MELISIDSIKMARDTIRPYVNQTPLIQVDFLNHLTKKTVWLKCEVLQKTGSFKIRGATYCILKDSAQAKRAGVIASSAGNHAQGVASICHTLGISSTIVMPVSTPAIKVHNTQNYGAKVELVGEIYEESYEHAIKLSQEKGLLFVHPYHDSKVIAGQGTLGLEIAEDPAFRNIEAVVVAIGGGGLISGCSIALKALNPKIKIYGVTPKNAPATWKSFQQKKATELDVTHTLAEGVSVKTPDDKMLSLFSPHVEDVFALSEESIAHAISLLAEQCKLVVEGAGALPLAAVLEGLIPDKKVALILSGGNIDITTLSHILERGLVQQGRLVRLLINVADRPGGLHALTGVLKEERANILHVLHQRATLHTAMGEAEVEVDLETRGKEHSTQIVEALNSRGFQVKRIN